MHLGKDIIYSLEDKDFRWWHHCICTSGRTSFIHLRIKTSGDDIIVYNSEIKLLITDQVKEEERSCCPERMHPYLKGENKITNLEEKEIIIKGGFLVDQKVHLLSSWDLYLGRTREKQEEMKSFTERKDSSCLHAGRKHNWMDQEKSHNRYKTMKLYS